MNRRLGTGLDYIVPNRERVTVYLDEDALMQPFHWRAPRRVFVCSMTDLFADFLTDEMRNRVFAVMALTTHLTYQVLTKRAAEMERYRKWRAVLPNVHLGVSVENQKCKDRIDHLRNVPAAVRWLSIEPLLEDIGTLDLRGISWVVIGGESGPGARPFNVQWARDIIRQCREAGVAVFMKQMGSRPIATGVKFKLENRKGSNPSEWPQDIRVQEYPV
jgi:protein gp37